MNENLEKVKKVRDDLMVVKNVCGRLPTCSWLKNGNYNRSEWLNDGPSTSLAAIRPSIDRPRTRARYQSGQSQLIKRFWCVPQTIALDRFGASDMIMIGFVYYDYYWRVSQRPRVVEYVIESFCQSMLLAVVLESCSFSLQKKFSDTFGHLFKGSGQSGK